MWPPSSGSTGSRFSRPSARLIEPEHEQEVAQPLPPRLRRDAHDPDRARHLVRVPAGREVTDAAHRVGGDAPRQRQRVAGRSRQRLARAGARLDRDPDPVGAVSCFARSGPSTTRLPLRTTISLNGLPLCGADVRRDVVRLRRLAGDAQDPVARLDVRGGGRAARDDAADDVRVLLGRDQEEAVKSTTAKTRLTAGPAKIAVSRRHVACRQYASGASDHSSSCHMRVSPSAGRKLVQLGVGARPSPRARSRRRAARARRDAARGPPVRSVAARSPGDGRFMPGIFT